MLLLNLLKHNNKSPLLLNKNFDIWLFIEYSSMQ